jgi:hypothetical protein
LQTAPSGTAQPNSPATPESKAPKSTFAPNSEDESSDAGSSDSDSGSTNESTLKPIPDSTTGAKKGGYSVPRYNFGDRTTSVQVKRAVYQPAVQRTKVSAPAVGPVEDDVLDDSGWRAARK